MQDGQFCKALALTACFVCCVPALADNDKQPNDAVAPSYGKTYVGKPQICSNNATDDGSGPAVFSWLVDLYAEAFPVLLSPLGDSYRASPVHANVCLKHALTGEPLPVHGQSMQDILDHCGLLGASQQPRYAYLQGASQEAPRLSEFDMALIRQFDQKIYQAHCTGCHIRY